MKPHACLFCKDQNFQTEQQLKEHMVQVHSAKQGRPKSSSSSAVCIVLPKRWEQHAESSTVEQTRIIQQQRPTIYKCITCTIGFHQVNDLLTHCANEHGPEPRLEIAIDYNKQQSNQSDTALMDFIRVPDQATEIGMQQQHQPPQYHTPTPPLPRSSIAPPPIPQATRTSKLESTNIYHSSSSHHSSPHITHEQPVENTYQKQSSRPQPPLPRVPTVGYNRKPQISKRPPPPPPPQTYPRYQPVPQHQDEYNVKEEYDEEEYFVEEDDIEEQYNFVQQVVEEEEPEEEEPRGRKPSFVCEVCGKAFKRSRERQKHMLLHGMNADLRCHDCKMDFTWEWTLNIHLKEKHGIIREATPLVDISTQKRRQSQQSNNSGAPTIPPRAEIAAISKPGSSGWTVQSQQQTPPPLPKRMKQESSSTVVDTESQCEFCGKQLSRRRDLNRHISNVHLKGNTGTAKQAKLQCNTCLLFFIRHEHLQNHNCSGQAYDVDEYDQSAE